MLQGTLHEWNPVKELKAANIVNEDIVRVKWNPVKELKEFVDFYVKHK